jgi:hypothetical protein
MPELRWHDESERSDLAVVPVHLPRMRPPSFWPGSICHLPPTRVGRLIITAFSGNQLRSRKSASCFRTKIFRSERTAGMYRENSQSDQVKDDQRHSVPRRGRRSTKPASTLRLPCYGTLMGCDLCPEAVFADHSGCGAANTEAHPAAVSDCVGRGATLPMGSRVVFFVSVRLHKHGTPCVRSRRMDA